MKFSGMCVYVCMRYLYGKREIHASKCSLVGCVVVVVWVVVAVES